MPKWFLPIVTSLIATEAGGAGSFHRYSHFKQDWCSDERPPSVIFIEPAYSEGPLSDPCDDHAPTGVAKGQAFLADVYQNLISNPARWARTMMIVTYDEHGGFYDHEPPLPIACTIAPTAFTFQTTGLRVPAFVISPQVQPGSVFPGALDHTSILQLLADRFSTDGHYSPAVDGRQQQLDRLARVLAPSATPGLAPSIPSDVLDQVIQAAASAPPTPPSGADPSDPPNAQALHGVALKLQNERPELLADPAWSELKDYLASGQPAPQT